MRPKDAPFPEDAMSGLTLYLLRHGESQANADRIWTSRSMDPPLTETGRDQIKQQAEVLSARPLSRMFASPLLRTRQTAEIVSRRTGLAPSFTADLLEMDIGLLEGKSDSGPAVTTIYPALLKEWESGRVSARFPDGESLQDAAARFGAFLGRLGAVDQEEILVVGHSLLFLAAIWWYCDNRGDFIQGRMMHRGHLSIMGENGSGFSLIRFDLAPGALEPAGQGEER
jgi:broad specificity phosphatase PhoE